jgi:glyoxylase-like metal-dependent hydrolase (beta-lactamase superfamily II)
LLGRFAKHGALALLGACASASEPPAAPRELSPEVIAIQSGDTWAYLLTSDAGTLLIDSGSDPEARAIRAELTRRALPAPSAILLTCGHPDVARGVAAFPEATIYLSNPEHALARGDRAAGYALARWQRRRHGAARLRGLVRSALPGARLEIAGHVVEVVSLPGHSAGSMAYATENILFSGDTLHVTTEGIEPPPWYLAESTANARRSANRALGVSFAGLADARGGWAADGRARLKGALAGSQPTWYSEKR